MNYVENLSTVNVHNLTPHFQDVDIVENLSTAIVDNPPVRNGSVDSVENLSTAIVENSMCFYFQCIFDQKRYLTHQNQKVIHSECG